jgi:sensor domain CHASE-containing protein
MLINILLIILAVFCVSYWAYYVAVYDWDNFEQDQQRAKEDFF